MHLDGPRWQEWLRRLCVVAVALALSGMAIVIVIDGARERLTDAAEADQIKQFLAGAAQQVNRALNAANAGEAPATVEEALSQAESAVRELQVAMLWYNQRQATDLPRTALIAYGNELHALWRLLNKNGSLSADEIQQLMVINQDLHLINQLYSDEALHRNRPAELAAIRHKLSTELSDVTARELIIPAP